MAAQPIESIDIGADPTVDVPPWSGKFIEFIPRTLGLMMIHADDTRTHAPPPGWKFTRGVTEDPVYVNDVELWPVIAEDVDKCDSLYLCISDFVEGEW